MTTDEISLVQETQKEISKIDINKKMTSPKKTEQPEDPELGSDDASVDLDELTTEERISEAESLLKEAAALCKEKEYAGAASIFGDVLELL